MALETGTKLRKGDVVSLRGVVEYDTVDGADTVHVRIAGVMNPVMVFGAEGIDAITLVYHAFRKGDVVRLRDGGRGHWTVLSTSDGEWVWCQNKREDFGTFSASFLVHVAPGEEEPATRAELPSVELPKGCRVRDDGVLIVPDDYEHTQRSTKGNFLWGYFREIQTESGVVLKSVSWQVPTTPEGGQ